MSKSSPPDSFSSLTNLKFIKFKKAANLTQNNQIDEDVDEAHSDSAKEFYLDLITKGQDKDKRDDNEPELLELKNKKNTLRPKKNEASNNAPNHKNLTKNDYLKAAQANDLNLIKNYLENNTNKLNELDEFKWNVLMIAIASLNNSIVKYLLTDDKIIKNVNFSEMIQNKDASGNDAASIAIKFRNREATEMLENVGKHESVSSESRKYHEEKESSEFFCEICNKMIHLNAGQSFTDHVKSIAHQLNERESSKDDDNQAGEHEKRPKANYYLRPSNKGYQLLVKSGWNEASGLGAREQGDQRPIRTKQKMDRLGIGLTSTSDNTKKVCNTTRSKKLFQLNTGDLKQSTTTGRIEDEFKRQNFLKKSQKKLKKAKEFERNMRFYFNN